MDGVMAWLTLLGIAWLIAMPITFGPAVRRAQSGGGRR